jgi:hypothetical protein
MYVSAMLRPCNPHILRRSGSGPFGSRGSEDRAVGPMSTPRLDPAVALVIEFVGTDVICRLRGLPVVRPEVR